MGVYNVQDNDFRILNIRVWKRKPKKSLSHWIRGLLR